MKNYFPAAKKQCSTLALGCALIVSTALALVNCTDPTAPATFTVTFDTNGGTPAIKDKTVEDGKLLAKPATEPSKEGFSFEGWFKDKALTQVFNFSSEKITANITLYAKWIEAHTVTFNSNGGTDVDPQSVVSGKKASKPIDPTKEGHTFENWYTDAALATPFDFNGTITQNITLYAKWVPKGTTVTYTVTFNSNQGSKTDPQTIESGKKASKPNDPTKTDSTFAGWYKDQGLTQAFDFVTETITADITLYAKWIEAHTVTFNANGGTNVEPQAVESGKKASKPTDPTKADSTLAGWFKDQALTQVFDFEANTITQDITLYAKWIEAHTVTFNLNDGGTPNEEDKIVAHGERVPQPSSSPQKTDSVFAGWYKDEALTQLFEFSTEKITADITLYAKWFAFYTVTFNANGGTPNEGDKFVIHGERVQQPSPNPTKTDSLFTGWYNDQALTQAFDFEANTITQDITLYARWVKAYTVTFNLNGGTSNENDKAVEAGTLLAQPSPNPTKTGFLFTGWYKNQALTQAFDLETNTITQDITLYAKWVEAYTVTFNLNGGTSNEEDKAVEAGTLLAQPSPNPTKTGFLFVGWYNDQALTQAFDFEANTITQDITLYAKWIEVHTVTFIPNNGENRFSRTVADESNVPRPENPTKTGFLFAGWWWYKEAQLYQAFDFETNTITANTILYAKWTPTSYTVTFNLNGGTPNEEDKTVEAGTLLARPSPDPTKTGFLFVGWYKEAWFYQTFDFEADTITAGITLHARWASTRLTTANKYLLSRLDESKKQPSGRGSFP